MLGPLYLATHLLFNLLVAIIAFAIPGAVGTYLWRALFNKEPSTVELVGGVYYLGLMPLTLVALTFVFLGLCDDSTLFTLALLVTIPCLWTIRRCLKVKWDRLWLIMAPMLAGELIVCAAPNTFFDAHSYHYALVENFRRFRDISPHGLSYFEFNHLNSELLNSLAMSMGGEIAANVAGFVQSVSFGFTLLLIGSELMPQRWAAGFAIIGLSLPVVVHQSTGGGNDTLLSQAVLLCFWSYLRATKCQAMSVQWLVLCGLFAGYAWGVKQSAPALLLPIVGLALFDWARGTIGLTGLLAGSASCLAVASAWIIRTFSNTGNPLYPAFRKFTTRLTHVPDFEPWAGTPSLSLDGFARMLVKHSHPSQLTNSGVPPWLTISIFAALLVFIVHFRSSCSLIKRVWLVAGAGMLVSCYFFSAYPRYAIVFYLFAALAAFATAARERGSFLQWLCCLTVVLSLILGTAVSTVRAVRRYRVLTGTISQEEFLASKYPNLKLLSLARSRALLRGEGSLLVFDHCAYKNGLETYNGHPAWLGERLVNWASGSPEEILKNCRDLKIRWILIPHELRQLEDVRLIETWPKIRPNLKPLVSIPGLTLYEVSETR